MVMIRLHLFGGSEDAQGDGEVKAGAFLFDVGGRKVDRRAAHGEFAAGIGERRGDAVFGLLDGGIGQANHDDDRVPVSFVDFHCHRIGVNAINGR